MDANFEMIRANKNYILSKFNGKTKEEIYELDKVIAPLIKEKHQSISHIYNNHPDEINFSRSTMYNYKKCGC